MGRGRALMLAAMVAAATTSSSAAHAEAGRLAIDWGRLLVDLDSYARTGAERPQVQVQHHAAATAERTNQLYVQNAGNAWFGVAPRVSFVARDWGGAYRLSGDRLSLVDAMRLTSSTRMVLTRVRLGDFGTTRIMPFAQLGFGQWRTDTNFLPFTPRATEIAGQVGGGVELNLGRKWQLAWETSATLFIRDERDAIADSRMWSTTLATRLEW